MADGTAIPLVHATWNPITGCDRVSPGCRHCYALGFARRLAGRYGYPKSDPFAVTLHPDKFDQPLRWKKPRTIFVCSMGDLFHPKVTDNTLETIFSVFAETPQHTYMVLTKRPKQMVGWLKKAPESLLRRVNRNLWLGVSAEDQQRANERIPLLINAWSGYRFVCLEPLLGCIDLQRWMHALDWVITGGETGTGGRQAEINHLRKIRDQCVEAGVPLFFKQWGGRNNKKRANTLDGEKWEQQGKYTAMRKAD